MTPPELRITVGDLDAGGKQYSFPLRAAWVRGVLEDHEATSDGTDGTLEVRASRSGHDVVVHGTLRAGLVVPCARCLSPVPLAIDEALSLLFVPGKTTPPPVAPKAAHEKADGTPAGKKKKKRHAEIEELEISAEDADTLPYDGEVVVLDDVVRDELILETPIFPLCSEDCPGISAPPGVSSAAGGRDHASKNTPTRADGDASSDTNADVDPRLLPLLRLRTHRD